MKSVLKLIVIFSLLILFIYIYQPVEAQDRLSIQSWSSMDVQDTITTFQQDSLYLPVIHACTINEPSPFSLQIAALHEIPPLAPGSIYDTSSDAAFMELTEALKESGADWTRLYVSWEQIEPAEPIPNQPPVYNWSWYDGRIRRIIDLGVKPFLTVGVAPGWAAETPCSPINPNRLGDFTRFLTDIVNRYQQAPYNIHHWELVNEPDGVSPDSWMSGWGCWGNDGAVYANMLSAAYQAIKAADPQAIVLMGGLAYDGFIEYSQVDPSVNFNRYFVDDVMQAGGGAAMDALNLHYFAEYHREWERWDPNDNDRIMGWLPAPTCGNIYDGQGQEYYVGGIDVIAKINHFRSRMGACYGVEKPLWLTELAAPGYPNDPGSLVHQARYVIAGHVRALAAGVKNITWYALVTQDGYEQGLLDQDWNPKPSFYAYKTLTSELTGYTYKNTLMGAGYEGYVFEQCGTEKTVIWGSAALPFSGNQLSVVDRFGRKVELLDGDPGDMDGVVNGSIRLQLTDDPVFVEAFLK